MEDTLKTLLSDGIKSIDEGLLNPLLIQRLEKYYDLIKLFNPALGLVASDDRGLVTRHLLDSLAPLPIIRETLEKENGSPHIEIADLGSGNGMPGLVLACASPDNWHFSLVERMGRRTGFLRNAVAVTSLSGKVEVIQSDIGELDRSFDVLVMRAFRPFDAVEKQLLRLTHEGSLVFVWDNGEKHGVCVYRKTPAAVFQKLPI